MIFNVFKLSRRFATLKVEYSEHAESSAQEAQHGRRDFDDDDGQEQQQGSECLAGHQASLVIRRRGAAKQIDSSPLLSLQYNK